MVGVFFAIVAVMALLSICGEFAMRVRLTKIEPSRDKLAWWRRGGDEIAATYEELFPHSPLPRFRRLAFWLFVTFCAIALLAILWKSH